jgi:hypothetical protein
MTAVTRNLPVSLFPSRSATRLRNPAPWPSSRPVNPFIPSESAPRLSSRSTVRTIIRTLARTIIFKPKTDVSNSPSTIKNKYENKNLQKSHNNSRHDSHNPEARACLNSIRFVNPGLTAESESTRLRHEDSREKVCPIFAEGPAKMVPMEGVEPTHSCEY